MKLDSSTQEDAQRLGEALVERAREFAERLKSQAQEDAERLEEKVDLVAAVDKAAEGTLLHAAAAVYAKDFDVSTVGGWPLGLVELRFANRNTVQFCVDRDDDANLPSGRYRALLVFTRID